ncbi:hypothetical protein ME7_01289 [Bartonella birtlesii LL-WM9]|uniref:Uncharacterized protein n=1 Tax=Bartonella birtlesii LL-WM9 TaxID=1094552 RepID=J0YK96_9HYPH|nr:hypothetical protein ME7_01289 [Bartonella birtlesii LL-WM9]
MVSIRFSLPIFTRQDSLSTCLDAQILLKSFNKKDLYRHGYQLFNCFYQDEKHHNLSSQHT